MRLSREALEIRINDTWLTGIKLTHLPINYWLTLPCAYVPTILIKLCQMIFRHQSVWSRPQKALLIVAIFSANLLTVGNGQPSELFHWLLAWGSLQNYLTNNSNYNNYNRLARSAYDCWQRAAVSLWLITNYFKGSFQSHHNNYSRFARSAYDCWQGAAFSLWLITGSLICLSNLFVLKKSELLLTKAWQFQFCPMANQLKIPIGRYEFPS